MERFWEQNKEEIRDAVRSNNHSLIYQKFESCWCDGFREGHNTANNPNLNSDGVKDTPPVK